MAQDIDWEKGAFSNPQGSEPDWESGEFAEPKKPTRSLADWGKDIATTALKGAIGVPEALVGLADIPTGGAVGKFLENEGGSFGFRPKQAKEFLNDQQSEATKAARKEFQQAEGIGGKAVAALSNPSVLATTVGESLPSMFAGGALAKGIGLAAPALAGRAGLTAAGEGLIGAGSLAESVRQQTPDGLLTPTQSALAAGAGLATAGLGALGARAGKALGVGDIDSMIANGAAQGVAREGMGLASRVGRGALSEGVLEELPQSLSETAFENVALDKPVTEGMDEAAVLGTLSGGLMGGVAGGLSSPAKPSQQMGIDPNAGPLSRAAASAVDSQPTASGMGFNPDAGATTVFPDGSQSMNSDSEIIGRSTAVVDGKTSTKVNRRDGSVEIDGVQVVPPSQPLAAEKKPAQSAPVAPSSESIPLEQRSLDELRQAFRSAQDPAIRKTLAAEIRKRREAMPDPLAPVQPQQEIALEPQASQAVQSQPQEAQAEPARPVALGEPLTDAGTNLLGRGADPLQSIIQGQADARRAADELRGTTGASTVTGGDITPPSVESPVADVRSTGRNDDAGTAQPDANRDAGRAVGSTAEGSSALTQGDVKEWSSTSFDSWKRQGMDRGTASGWTIFYDHVENTYRLGRKVKDRNEAGGGYVRGEVVTKQFKTADEAKAWAKGQADTSKNASDQPSQRPDNWRGNAIKAGKVARSLGLDPKGKRLKEIVAEIDAVDAGSGVSAKPVSREQAIRDAWWKEPRTIGKWTPITVTAEGQTAQMLVNQKRAGGDKAGALHVVNIRMGKMLKDMESEPIAYTFRLTADNRLVEEGIPTVATPGQIAAWKGAGFALDDKQANVQNTPQGTAGEAKAPSVKESKAEGGNAASNAGVPAAPGAGDVQADGVKSSKAKGPATAQQAIDAFNADDSASAMEVVARLKIDELQKVGAAIGFRPQINENAKRYRERLSEVAAKLTKTGREEMRSDRAVWDRMSLLASEWDRMERHTGAPEGSYDGKWMNHAELRPYLLAELAKLESSPFYEKNVEMVSKARPALFKAAQSKQKEEAKKDAAPAAQTENKYAAYDDVARQYGYEVRQDGSIGSNGKFPGVTMSIKKGRLRFEGKSGNLLASYAPTPESLGKFLQSFWYAEKKAARQPSRDEIPMPNADDPLFEQKNAIRQLQNTINAGVDPQGGALRDDRREGYEKRIKELQDEIAQSSSLTPAAQAEKPAEDDAFMGVEDQTQTEAFKKWFAGSKVVDDQGNPLVVYHGTRGEFTVFDYSRIGQQGRAEGAGFYFTNSKDVASGYGAPMEVFLSIKKPLAYDAKPFSRPVVEKIVRRVAELEAQAEGGDIADGFLANFGDVRSEGLASVVRQAGGMIAADETALDQLSGIVGSGVNPEFVNRATRDVTGFDGVVAKGFSNAGDASNSIYVAFFPEQIKSATGNRGTFDPANPDITFAGTKAKATRQGTPVDRAIMDMAGEGREANEILSFIAKSSKSPYRRQLAQKLLATGANPAVSLGGEMGGGAGFRFLAKYSRKNHEVTLSEAAADRAEQIFLHETVHSATLLALDKGGLIATQMNRLYESVKAQGGADGQYGLKNVGEFVAEAFTNPDFQKALKGMKADNGSLWDRLVNIVRRILGMEPKEQDALSAALDLGAKVMRENMPLRAARSFRAEDGPAFAGEDEANFGIADASPNNAREAVQPVVQLLNDTFKVRGKIHWWHKTVGTPFNLAERVPEFKRVFNSVQDFINSVSFYGAEAAAMAPKIIPKLESWKDLGKSPIKAEDNKAIATPIFEGTLSWRRGKNGTPVRTDDVGDAGIVWTDDELRSMFKLNDEQIGLYREFRAATDKSLTDLALSDILQFAGKDAEPIKDTVMGMSLKEGSETVSRYLKSLAEGEDKVRKAMLFDTANSIKEKADKAQSLMDRGYAPLQRFGRHTLYATNDKGEQLFFGMYEDRWAAARAARQMREQYPGAKVEVGMMSEQSYKLFQGISPETLELFGTMLGLDPQADGQTNEAFQTYLKLAKSNRSALKRLIERKGISGYSEDASRVLASFIYSNARQTASNLHVGEIMNGVNDIPRDMGEAKDAAVKLARYTMDPQEEAQALRGLLFAQYLGGSIASAAINALQPAQVTFPYLSQFVGAKKSASLMTGAVRDALKKSTGDPRLDAELKKAEEEGIVSPQEIFQLMAQAQGKATLKAGDGTKAGDAMAAASNTLSRLSLGWGKVFSIPEQFNRRTTFIAAYRTAKETGEANPYEFAKQAVKETQLVYNKGNRPEWARGTIGALAFTFKTYSISYVELLQRMAASGPEGRRAALLMVGVLFIMAGAGGLPGVEDAEDVVDGIAQRVFGLNFQTRQKRQEWLADTFGEGGARFIENGLSGLPWSPTDVSGRLGLGNLIPGTGLFVKKENYGRDVAEIAGPAADMTKRFLEGAGLLLQGEVLKAGEIVSPTAVRNMIQGGRMLATDQYTDTKGRKVIDTTPAEGITKLIGFQPADVARVQEATGTTQRMIALNKIRESEIADKWAKGLASGDADVVQEARDELRKWNESNPESPIRINMPQLFRRVRALKEDKATRIARTAPKEIRQDVRRALEQGQ